MENIVPAISNREHPECGICLERFWFFQEKWTHAEVQNHVSFHRECLLRWIKQNPTCPYDRAPLNVSEDSLIMRADRAFQRIRRVFVNSTCTLLASGVSTTIGALTALTGGALVSFQGKTAFIEALAKAIIALGPLVSAIGAMSGAGLGIILESQDFNREGNETRNAIAIGVGTIGLTLSPTFWEESLEVVTRFGMVCMIAGAVGAVGAAKVAKKVFKHFETLEKDQIIVGIGVVLGGFTLLTDRVSMAIVPVAAAVFSGMISFFWE